MAKDKIDRDRDLDRNIKNDLDMGSLDSISLDLPGFGDEGIIKGKGRKPSSAKLQYAIESGKAIGGGVLEGAKQAFYNAVPNAEPLVSDVTDTLDDMRALKQDISKDLQPIIISVENAGRKFLPKAEKFIPKKVYNKIKETLDRRAAERRVGVGPSKSQLEQTEITDALTSIFGATAEMNLANQREQKKEGLVDRAVGSIRHKQNFAQMTHIYDAVRSTELFHRTQHMGYMKKSLELKYKHLFIARDTFNLLQSSLKTYEGYFKAITDNTALPDVMKKQMTDFIHGSRTERYGTLMANAMSNIRKKIFENIKNTAKSAIDILGMGTMGLDMASQMEGMEGFEDPNKPKVPKFLLNLLGHAAGRFGLGAKFGYGNPLARALNGGIAGMRINALNKYSEIQQKMLNSTNPLFNFLADILPNPFKEQSTASNDLLTKSKNPAVFDVLTRQSIVEIIPGYLGKIWHEVEMLRTGDTNVEEKAYNVFSRGFTTKSEIKADIAERAFGSEEDRRLAFTRSLSAIEGGLASNKPGYDIKANLDEKTKEIIHKIILNHGFRSQPFSPEKLLDYAMTGKVSYYVSKVISGIREDEAAIREAISVLCDSIYIGNTDNRKIDPIVLGKINEIITNAYLKNDKFRDVLPAMTEDHGYSWAVQGELNGREERELRKALKEWSAKAAKGDLQAINERNRIQKILDEKQGLISRDISGSFINHDALQRASKIDYSKIDTTRDANYTRQSVFEESVNLKEQMAKASDIGNQFGAVAVKSMSIRLGGFLKKVGGFFNFDETSGWVRNYDAMAKQVDEETARKLAEARDTSYLKDKTTGEVIGSGQDYNKIFGIRDVTSPLRDAMTSEEAAKAASEKTGTEKAKEKLFGSTAPGGEKKPGIFGSVLETATKAGKKSVRAYKKSGFIAGVTTFGSTVASDVDKKTKGTRKVISKKWKQGKKIVTKSDAYKSGKRKLSEYKKKISEWKQKFNQTETGKKTAEALAVLEKLYDEASSKFDECWESLNEIGILDKPEELVKYIREHYPEYRDILSDLPDLRDPAAVEQKLSEIATQAKDLGKKAADAVTDPVSKVAEAVREKINEKPTEGGKSIAEKVTEFTDRAVEQGKTAKEGVFDFFVNFFSKLKSGDKGTPGPGAIPKPEVIPPTSEGGTPPPITPTGPTVDNVIEEEPGEGNITLGSIYELMQEWRADVTDEHMRIVKALQVVDGSVHNTKDFQGGKLGAYATVWGDLTDKAKKIGKGAWNVTKKIGKAYTQIYKGALQGLGTAIKGVADLGRNALDKAWKGVTGVGKWLTHQEDYVDIYVKGKENRPIVSARMQRDPDEGIYFKGGKRVEHSRDIDQPCYDKNGNLVITEEDLEKGLVMNNGTPIGKLGKGLLSLGKSYFKMLGMAVGGGLYGIGKIVGSVINVLGGGNLPTYFDVYRKGEIEKGPVLTGKKQREEGVYFLHSGKKVERTADIDEEVMDKDRQVIISKEDIEHGLVGVNGKPLGYMKSLRQTLLSGMKGIGAFALGAAKKAGNFYLDFYSKLLGGAGGLLKGALKGIGGFIGRGLGLTSGKDVIGFDDEARKALLDSHNILSTMQKDLALIADQYRNKNPNDDDNDGDIDGSYKDQMEKREQKGKGAADKLKEQHKDVDWNKKETPGSGDGDGGSSYLQDMAEWELMKWFAKKLGKRKGAWKFMRKFHLGKHAIKNAVKLGWKAGGIGGIFKNLFTKGGYLGSKIAKSGVGRAGASVASGASKLAKGIGGAVSTAAGKVASTGAWKTMAAKTGEVGSKIAGSGIGKSIASASGKVGSKIASVAGKTGAKVAAAGGAKGILSGAGKIAGKAAVPVAIGIEAALGAKDAFKAYKSGDTREGNKAVGGTLGSIGGGLAGAKLGAAIGAAAGPVGAAIGGLVGAIGGSIVTSKAGKWVGGKITDQWNKGMKGEGGAFSINPLFGLIKGIRGNNAPMSDKEIEQGRARLQNKVKKGLPGYDKILNEFNKAIEDKNWKRARSLSGKEADGIIKSVFKHSITGKVLTAEWNFLFGKDDKEMTEDEIKKTRAKFQSIMKKGGNAGKNAERLLSKFNDYVAEGDWKSARKIAGAEQRGIFGKFFKDSKGNVQWGKVAGAAMMAIPGLNLIGGALVLSGKDENKPMSEKEIKDAQEWFQKQIKSGNKQAQKLLDQFNEAVTEQNWKKARKLAGKEVKSALSKLITGANTVGKIGARVGLAYMTGGLSEVALGFIGDQDKPMSDEEIKKFRDKMNFLITKHNDKVAERKLEKFDELIARQQWAKARQIAKMPHKGWAMKATKAVTSFFFGDDEKEMTPEEISKFRESMNRKIAIGGKIGRIAQKKLDKFEDAVGAQRWKRARDIAKTPDDGLVQKVGKAYVGAWASQFRFLFGGDGKPMSDAEIEEARKKLGWAISEGKPKAQKRADMFEDFVKDEKWEKARRLVKMPYDNIAKRSARVLGGFLFGSDKDALTPEEIKKFQDECEQKVADGQGRYSKVLAAFNSAVEQENWKKARLIAKIKPEGVVQRVGKALNPFNWFKDSYEDCQKLKEEIEEKSLDDETGVISQGLEEFEKLVRRRKYKDAMSLGKDLLKMKPSEFAKKHKIKNKKIEEYAKRADSIEKELIKRIAAEKSFFSIKRFRLKGIRSDLMADPASWSDEFLDDIEDRMHAISGTGDYAKEEPNDKSVFQGNQLIQDVDKTSEKFSWLTSPIIKTKLKLLKSKIRSSATEWDEDTLFSWREELKEIAGEKAEDSRNRPPPDAKVMKDTNTLLKDIEKTKEDLSMFNVIGRTKLNRLKNEIESDVIAWTPENVKRWRKNLKEIGGDKAADSREIDKGVERKANALMNDIKKTNEKFSWLGSPFIKRNLNNLQSQVESDPHSWTNESLRVLRSRLIEIAGKEAEDSRSDAEKQADQSIIDEGNKLIEEIKKRQGELSFFDMTKRYQLTMLKNKVLSSQEQWSKEKFSEWKKQLDDLTRKEEQPEKKETDKAAANVNVNAVPDTVSGKIKTDFGSKMELDPDAVKRVQATPSKPDGVKKREEIEAMIRDHDPSQGSCEEKVREALKGAKNTVLAEKLIRMAQMKDVAGKVESIDDGTFDKVSKEATPNGQIIRRSGIRIAGEPISKSGLSDKQMGIIGMATAMGNKYPDYVMEMYNKQLPEYTKRLEKEGVTDKPSSDPEDNFADGGFFSSLASKAASSGWNWLKGKFVNKPTSDTDADGNAIQYGEAGPEAIMPLDNKPGNLVNIIGRKIAAILKGEKIGPTGGAAVHAGSADAAPMENKLAGGLTSSITEGLADTGGSMLGDLAKTGVTAAATAYGGPIGGMLASGIMNSGIMEKGMDLFKSGVGKLGDLGQGIKNKFQDLTAQGSEWLSSVNPSETIGKMMDKAPDFSGATSSLLDPAGLAGKLKESIFGKDGEPLSVKFDGSGDLLKSQGLSSDKLDKLIELNEQLIELLKASSGKDGFKVEGIDTLIDVNAKTGLLVGSTTDNSVTTNIEAVKPSSLEEGIDLRKKQM